VNHKRVEKFWREQALKVLGNSLKGSAFISMMAPAYNYRPHIRTVCGVMIFCELLEKGEEDRRH